VQNIKELGNGESVVRTRVRVRVHARAIMPKNNAHVLIAERTVILFLSLLLFLIAGAPSANRQVNDLLLFLSQFAAFFLRLAPTLPSCWLLAAHALAHPCETPHLGLIKSSASHGAYM
jgi:hypothetical protein